jgi:hypothetical protein
LTLEIFDWTLATSGDIWRHLAYSMQRRLAYSMQRRLAYSMQRPQIERP